MSGDLAPTRPDRPTPGPTPGAGRGAPPPPVGARVGDYVLERALGRGGMGAVFVGRHVEVGARRAIKVLAGAGTPEGRERFEREARALARLGDHPSIVQVHAAGVEGGVPYLVLELVEGTDLERALEAGPLPVERAVEVGAAVADALAHCHARGVLHRDLKPANVLLRQDGRPVVTDFGVARDAHEERLTATGALVGSPRHMAPEQVAGDRALVGPATDVFALGGLLHQLLTGAPPFEGETLATLAAAICAARPRPLRTLRPDVPADLEALVLLALEKEPARRPSAARVRDALRAIARGEASGVDGRAPPRRAALAAGLAAAAGLVAALVAAIVLVPRARAAERLAALEAWTAATLDPWALGAAADEPSPVPADELRRRADELAAARPRLSGEAAARADALAARLDVCLRAATGAPPAGRPPRAGEGPLDLALVGLRQLRAGDAAAGRAAAERALALDPACAPARLVLLRAEAALDPRGFLRRARGLPAGDARAAALRLAPAALVLAQAAALAAPPERAAEVRRELEALAELARALEAPLEPLGPAKAAALDLVAAAWGEQLERAARRGAELEALRRLGGLLLAPPAARPGPALAARLDAALGALQGAHDAAVARKDEVEAARAIARVVAAEAAATYEVDPARTPPASLELAVERHLTFGQGWRGEALAELTLAALRTGTTLTARHLVQRLDPDAVAAAERWRATRPRSRAARYVLTSREVQEGRRPNEPARQQGERLLAALGRTLEPGLQEDLAPRHLADALVNLATWHQHLLPMVEGDPAQVRAHAEAVVAACARGRAVAFFGDDLAELHRLGAASLHLLGRREEALALLRAGAALFEARVQRGARGALVDAEQQMLGLLRLAEADQLATAGEDEAALAALAKAEEAARASMIGKLLEVLAARAGILRRRGDPAGARAALTEPRGHEESHRYATEAVRAALALGDVAGARRLVDEARRALRHAEAVEALEREVRAAEVRAAERGR